MSDRQNDQANELPDLRAWARQHAMTSQSPTEVAEALSTQWGIGPIPLRKLLMETFQIGLGDANEICGSIQRHDQDHPHAQAANLQLQTGWLRDITKPGTQIKLSYQPQRGWFLSMARHSRTIGISLDNDNDSPDSPKRSAEQLIINWVPVGVAVAWNPTHETHQITGTIVAAPTPAATN